MSAKATKTPKAKRRVTRKDVSIKKAIARVWEYAMEMYEKNDPNHDGPPPFRLQMGLRTVGLMRHVHAGTNSALGE